MCIRGIQAITDLLHTLLAVRCNYVSLKDCQACMNMHVWPGISFCSVSAHEKARVSNILTETAYCMYLYKE